MEEEEDDEKKSARIKKIIALSKLHEMNDDFDEDPFSQANREA